MSIKNVLEIVKPGEPYIASANRQDPTILYGKPVSNYANMMADFRKVFDSFFPNSRETLIRKQINVQNGGLTESHCDCLLCSQSRRFKEQAAKTEAAAIGAKLMAARMRSIFDRAKPFDVSGQAMVILDNFITAFGDKVSAEMLEIISLVKDRKMVISACTFKDQGILLTVDGPEFNFVLYIYGNGTDMETAKIKLNGIRKAVPLNVLLELLK